MLSSGSSASVGAILRLAILAMAFLAAACMSPASAAGKRVALVIGNSAYKAVSPLPNPANDAAAIATSLAKIGFSVTHLSDLGGNEMRRALQDFEDTAMGAEIAIVYYAGHGIELNGENYLIPVDAALVRDSHVEDETCRCRASCGRRRRLGAEPCHARRMPRQSVCAKNAAELCPAFDRARLARVEPAGRRWSHTRPRAAPPRGWRGRAQPVLRGGAHHIETPGSRDLLFREVHDDVYAATAQQQSRFFTARSARRRSIWAAGRKPVVETPPRLLGGDTAAGFRRSADGGRLPRALARTEEAYRAFLEKHPNSARPPGQRISSRLVENEVGPKFR